MNTTNIVIKEQNLDLLKTVQNSLQKVQREYKGYIAPCVVFEDTDFIYAVKTLDEYNSFIGKTKEDIIEIIKSLKIKEAHSKYQQIIDDIKKIASSYEVETWATQNTEWTSYVADNTSSTPFVDTLAVAREITRDELMAKIGTKVTAIASILGTQQKLEDDIKACITQAELDLIIID